MKKNLLIVAIAIFSLATVSCGKKAETPAAPATETPAAPAAETPAPAAEGDVITQYEAFVDKYIAIMKKVQAGDTASINELTKLNEEAAKFQENFATESASFTQEQQDRLAAIAKKLTDALAK